MIQFGASPAFPVTPVYHRSNKPIYPHRPTQFGMADVLELTSTRAEIREERYTTAQGVTVPLEISSLAPPQFIQTVKDALDQVPAYILGLAVNAGYSTRIVRRQRPEELPSKIGRFSTTAGGTTYNPPQLIALPFEFETEKGSNKFQSYDNLNPLALIDTIIHENLHAISDHYAHLFPKSSFKPEYLGRGFEIFLHEHNQFHQARWADIGTSFGLTEEFLEAVYAAEETKDILSEEEREVIHTILHVFFSPAELWARAGSIAVRTDDKIGLSSTGWDIELPKIAPQSINVMHEFYLPRLRDAYAVLN